MRNEPIQATVTFTRLCVCVDAAPDGVDQHRNAAASSGVEDSYHAARAAGISEGAAYVRYSAEVTMSRVLP